MSGISFFGDGFCKNLRSKTKYLVAAAGLAAAMNLGVQINTAEAAHLENNKIQNAVVSVSPGPGNFVGSDYFNSETAKLMVSKYTLTVISTLSKTSGISVDQIKTAYENMHRDSDEYIAKYGGGARFRSKLGLDEMNGQNVNFVDCMRVQFSERQQEYAYLNPAVHGGNDLQRLDWAKSYENRAACVYTAMSSLQKHGIDANGMLMTETAKEKFADCMGVDYEDAIKDPKLVLAIPYFADNPYALKDIVDAYKTMPDMNPEVLKNLSRYVNNIKDGPFAYDRSVENKKIGQRNLMMDMNVAKCIQSGSNRGFLSLVDIYKAKPHMCNDEVKQYVELGIRTFGNTLKSVNLDEMQVTVNGLEETKDTVMISGIQKDMMNYFNSKYEYDKNNKEQSLEDISKSSEKVRNGGIEWETSAQINDAEKSKFETNKQSLSIEECLGDTVAYNFADMGDGTGFSKTTVVLNSLSREGAEKVALNSVSENMQAKGLLTEKTSFKVLSVEENNNTYKVEIQGSNVYCDKVLQKEMNDLRKTAEMDASEYKMNGIHNAMEKVEKSLGDISEAGMKKLDAQLKIEDYMSKNGNKNLENEPYIKEVKELSSNFEKANSHFEKSVEKLGNSVSDLRKATVARFGDNKEVRESLNRFDVSLRDYKDVLAGNNPEAMKNVKEQVQSMGKNFMETTGNVVNQEMARDNANGIDRKIENKELGMSKVNEAMEKMSKEMIDMANIDNGVLKGKTMDECMDNFSSCLDKLKNNVVNRFADNKTVLDSFNNFKNKAVDFQSSCDGPVGTHSSGEIFAAQDAAKDFMKVAGEAVKREQAIANAPFVVPEQPLDGQYRSMMHTVKKLDGLTGKLAENRVVTKMVETLNAKGKSMDSIREEVSGVLANNSPFFVGEKAKEDALRFTNNVCDRVEEKEKVKVREATLDRSKVNSTELQGNKPQGKNSEGISM